MLFNQKLLCKSDEKLNELFEKMDLRPSIISKLIDALNDHCNNKNKGQFTKFFAFVCFFCFFLH